MKELINYERLKYYCVVSSKGGDIKFTSKLRMTQLTEIQNFLGKELFFELMYNADVSSYPATFTDQKLKFLFFGGEYMHENKVIFVRGVEEALSNYLYANMIKSDALMTPTGFEDKINIYATKAAENQRAFEVNDRVNYAASCLNDLIFYLRIHYNDHGIKCGCEWARHTTVSSSNSFFKIR